MSCQNGKNIKGEGAQGNFTDWFRKPDQIMDWTWFGNHGLTFKENPLNQYKGQAKSGLISINSFNTSAPEEIKKITNWSLQYTCGNELNQTHTVEGTGYETAMADCSEPRSDARYFNFCKGWRLIFTDEGYLEMHNGDGPDSLMHTYNKDKATLGSQDQYIRDKGKKMLKVDEQLSEGEWLTNPSGTGFVLNHQGKLTFWHPRQEWKQGKSNNIYYPMNKNAMSVYKISNNELNNKNIGKTGYVTAQGDLKAYNDDSISFPSNLTGKDLQRYNQNNNFRYDPSNNIGGWSNSSSTPIDTINTSDANKCAAACNETSGCRSFEISSAPVEEPLDLGSKADCPPKWDCDWSDPGKGKSCKIVPGGPFNSQSECENSATCAPQPPSWKCEGGDTCVKNDPVPPPFPEGHYQSEKACKQICRPVSAAQTTKVGITTRGSIETFSSRISCVGGIPKMKAPFNEETYKDIKECVRDNPAWSVGKEYINKTGKYDGVKYEGSLPTLRNCTGDPNSGVYTSPTSTECGKPRRGVAMDILKSGIKGSCQGRSTPQAKCKISTGNGWGWDCGNCAPCKGLGENSCVSSCKGWNCSKKDEGKFCLSGVPGATNTNYKCCDGKWKEAPNLLPCDGTKEGFSTMKEGMACRGWSCGPGVDNWKPGQKCPGHLSGSKGHGYSCCGGKWKYNTNNRSPCPNEYKSYLIKERFSNRIVEGMENQEPKKCKLYGDGSYGTTPDALRVKNPSSSIYVRKPDIKNVNYTCTKNIKFMKDINSENWDTYKKDPTGNMTNDFKCNLAAFREEQEDTVQKRREDLAKVVNKVKDQMEYLTEEEKKLLQEKKKSDTRFAEQINIFDKISNTIKNSDSTSDQRQGQVDDSVLVLTKKNYQYIFWSILAVLFIIASLKISRN
jgi:hypothetical protein